MVYIINNPYDTAGTFSQEKLARECLRRDFNIDIASTRDLPRGCECIELEAASASFEQQLNDIISTADPEQDVYVRFDFMLYYLCHCCSSNY